MSPLQIAATAYGYGIRERRRMTTTRCSIWQYGEGRGCFGRMLEGRNILSRSLGDPTRHNQGVLSLLSLQELLNFGS